MTVNGELRDISEATTLRALMHHFGLKPELTAVQINDEIVNRKEHDNVVLKPGDRIELIRVVGGG